MPSAAARARRAPTVVVELFSDRDWFSESRVVGMTVTPCMMSVMPSLEARRAARRMSCHWRVLKQPYFAAAALGFTLLLIWSAGS